MFHNLLMRQEPFPSPLAENPGVTLLFATWLQENKLGLREFLKRREGFENLELICADRKCRRPYSLSGFSCRFCGDKNLNLKVDVKFEKGEEKIVPGTLRIWCSNTREEYQGPHSMYGTRFGARCKDDGARLEYFLVGNERDEFLPYTILELSTESGKTTPFYQAVLSGKTNVSAALDFLAKKGFLKKEGIDLSYRNWIKEPSCFKMTKKGKEELSRLRRVVGYDNRRNFERFIIERRQQLGKIEEGLEQKAQRYTTLVRDINVTELPLDTLDYICAEFSADDFFQRKIDYALKHEEFSDALKEKLAEARNKNSLGEQTKLWLVQTLGIKYKGIKKALEIQLENDLQNDLQTVFPVLEKIYHNPGRIKIEREGCFFYFTIPKLTKNEEMLIEHVPSSCLPEIFQNDKNRVDYSLIFEL